MSLFLRRIYPPSDEFQLTDSIGAGLATGVDVMALGVTICLPGESEKPADLKKSGSPFIARFRAPGGGPGGEAEYFDLIRAVITKLFEGYQIEVRPGFYWSLLRNPAIAAELCVEREPGSDAILLMEKRHDRHKSAPDAVYRLSRLAEHEFLRDLLNRGDAPPTFPADEGDKGIADA
jgi:hypothetical protein